MGELLDYFKNRVSNKKVLDSGEKDKAIAKNTIVSYLDEYLHDVGDELVLEVEPKVLPIVITILNEEPFITKYSINQINKTLFRASLKELNI